MMYKIHSEKVQSGIRRTDDQFLTAEKSNILPMKILSKMGFLIASSRLEKY
jgi:hypothetical protein